MRRLGRALLLLALAAPLAAPWTSAGAAERIVSLGGSITEILYDLGFGDQIIAVDSTSLFPAEAREKPDVGYLRQLAAEPIVALGPTLVIGTEAAGPPVVIEQLEGAGLRLVLAPDEFSVAGALHKIAIVAAAVGRPAEGQALADAVEARFQQLEAKLAPIPARPSVLFLLAASKGAPMAAGQNTAADAMIAIAGGRNAVQGVESYKNLSPEAAIGLDPALVVIAEHALLTLGGIEALQARSDLGLIPAIREGRILVIDANLLLGFGPRSAEGAWELAKRLHPVLLGQAQ